MRTLIGRSPMKHRISTPKINLQSGKCAIFTGLMCFIVLAMISSIASGEEWATYRYDNARSGVTAEELTPPLSLRWMFRPAHPPRPAWTKLAGELPRMHFDSAYHVTVSDGTAYFD